MSATRKQVSSRGAQRAFHALQGMIHYLNAEDEHAKHSWRLFLRRAGSLGSGGASIREELKGLGNAVKAKGEARSRGQWGSGSSEARPWTEKMDERCGPREGHPLTGEFKLGGAAARPPHPTCCRKGNIADGWTNLWSMWATALASRCAATNASCWAASTPSATAASFVAPCLVEGKTLPAAATGLLLLPLRESWGAKDPLPSAMEGDAEKAAADPTAARSVTADIEKPILHKSMDGL